MTPLFASVFVVAAWAPLDSIAGYFGTPKLQDIASITPRDRALHNVEHVECRATSAGCLPAGGCTSSCEPRVGHYWVAPSPSGAASSPLLPLWLSAFLPPIGPSYHMMTSKGVMVIEPGFATIDYRMLVRTPTGLARAEEAHRRYDRGPPVPSCLTPSIYLSGALCVPSRQDDMAEVDVVERMPGLSLGLFIAKNIVLPGAIIFHIGLCFHR
jgi:hypothetical protein